MELRDELEVECRVGHRAKIRARTAFPRSGCPRRKSETYEPCCATFTRGCGGAPECSTGCRQSHSITPCDEALPGGVSFGTIVFVWLLLRGFRPEWQKVHYWVALASVTALHLLLWWFLVNRIDRFGFGLMFILLLVELIVAASVIAKIIPEDETAMLDYIHRW